MTGSSRQDAVLLSSFVVHPDMPSEPGIGWQFLLATLENAVSCGARVVLVTNRRSEIACRGRIPERYNGFLEIVAIDIPHAPSFFRRWHEPRFTRVEHEMWVRLAVDRVRDVERRYRLIYAHHVTFATEILTTPITRLSSNTYKVWGPVGAGGVAGVFLLEPWVLPSLKQALLQTMRDAVAAVPARSTARRCNLVLAQNGSLIDMLSSVSTASRLFPNVVVDAEDVHDGPGHPGSQIDILSVGHLIPRKRVELAIDVLNSASLNHAVLHIVGAADTDHSRYLKVYASKSGVAERVVFHGTLPRARILTMMETVHVLFHSSGREGASGVVGEATFCGLPVVCFDGTGAASVLIEAGTSGVRLNATRQLSRDDIARAITDAAAMPRIRSTMWSRDRFVELAATLYRDGLGYRDGLDFRS